jgi:uncharacterized membrane protein YjgN (DUF898 family)
MKKHFKCAITGAAWWKPFIAFVALTLAIMIPNELASLNPPDAPVKAFATLLLTLTLEGLLVVVQAAFSVILMRIAFPLVSIDEKPFAFTGKVGEYVKINIFGFLLCIVTLGFYIPAYARKIVAYLAAHTRRDGECASFLSKTGELMKYYLLALLVPVIAVCVLFAIIVVKSGYVSPVSGSYGPLTLALYLVLLLAIIPFVYLAYKWTVNFGWRDVTISWNTRFGPSCAFIAGQIALVVVTLGILWPVAVVNIVRYFAGKTVIRKNGTEAGRLGFDGTRGKGFTLLWGQTLLTIITLGIYLPWAYANCARFFVNGTYFEEKQELLDRA